MGNYVRKIEEIMTPRTCEWHKCRKRFMPTKPWQRFCCRTHLNAYHNLIISNARAVKRLKKMAVAA